MFSHFSYPPEKLLHFLFPVTVAVLQGVPFSSWHKSLCCWNLWLYMVPYSALCRSVYGVGTKRCLPPVLCFLLFSLLSGWTSSLPMPASCLRVRRRQMKQKTWLGSTRRNCCLPALLAEVKELFVHLTRARSWEPLSDCFLDLKKKIQDPGLFFVAVT